MTRFLTAGALALGLCLGALSPAAHADTPVPTFVSIPKPAAGTPIVVVTPEVSLGLLTAAGSVEPKDEWSKSARDDINASITQALSGRGYKVMPTAIDSYDGDRALQLLKLNDAVTSSIDTNAYPMGHLPTKTSFDWTLGDGASSLVPAGSDPAAPPAYVMFIHVTGSYASSGRAAMMVGMALLHVAVPLGGQMIQATLVDLKTGQVVWYQNVPVASGTDIRTPEGAGTAVTSLFKKLPL